MKFRAFLPALLSLAALLLSVFPGRGANLVLEGPCTAWMGPGWSYNLASNQMALGFGRIYNFSGSTSGPVSLELFAVIPNSSPAQGYSMGTYSDGSVVAPGYLPANSGLKAPFAQPPNGTYNMQMVLRESGVVRSVYNFGYQVRFGNIYFLGPGGGWQTAAGGNVSMALPAVYNRSDGGSSGQLKVELFAITGTYTNENLSPGHKLGTFTYANAVGARYRYLAGTATVPFTAPPNGTYTSVMVLSELVALPNTWQFKDAYVNLTPVTFGGTGAVATPAITPASGAYQGCATVSLSTATAGAEIRYTLDNSTPTESSTIYTGPFNRTTSATVKAKAFKADQTASGVSTATYTVTAASTSTPVFNPPANTFTASVQVALDAFPTGVDIHYTLDGTEPTTASPLYATGVPLLITTTTTIKARAFRECWTAGATATATYTITAPTVVATPDISPNGGTHSGSVQVSITCATSNAEIRYTLDGTTPTASHPQYTAPFTLTESKTVKARAFRSGYIDSGEATAAFTLTAPTLVTNTNDTGSGSLRQVLANAPAGSTITFAPTLSGRTIPLVSAGLALSRNVTVDASSLPGGVTISGDVTGNGFAGPGDVRVFHVQSGVVATFNGLTITGGYAANNGGGIFSEGQLTLSRCTIAGNAAGFFGGGIASTDYLTLHHCTLAGNFANSDGGALHCQAAPIISINNSTISGNSATQSGGGIFNSASVSLRHTILAGNTAASAPDFANSGVVYAAGPNLLGVNDSISVQFPFGPLTGSASNPLRPLLAPLGYYGGPTMTMPALIGSPALDASVLLTAPGTDQRGFPRLVGGRLDLGAVEGYYVMSDGAWDVREIIPTSGQITSLTQAEALIAAPGTATVLDYQTQMLNRSDPQFPGGGGFFGNEEPFAADNRTPRGLNGANGGDDDDFVLLGRCVIQVYAEDDYTFGFASDDGARLRIYGATFTSSTRLNDTNPADPAHNGSVLSFPGLTGNSDTLGVCHLTPGTYGLEFVTWERGGGAFAEVFMAKGAKTAVDSSFRLVGDATPARGFSNGIVPEPGFQVTVIRDGALSLAEAIADITGHWNGTSPGVSVSTATPAVINHHDPERGGSGHALPPQPFPGNEPGNDEHFALGAKAPLHITVPGIYSFAVRGDDGSRFRIPGTTGWTASGSARALPDGFQVDGCCRDGLGHVYLAAGDYEVELIWQEYEGEAYVSLWGAWGLHRAFDAGAFSLVGSNIEESAQLKTAAWDVVTIYDGDDGLPAALTRIYNRWSGLAPGTNAVTATATTINYTDPQNGGGGHGFAQIPFRGHTTGDDNYFSLGARSRLTVTIGGEYTFALLSDDGARLRITGTRDWKVTSPDAGQTQPRALPDGMELTNCCGDVFGTVTLAAGTYDIEFIYNERFGGAYAGLFAARGSHTEMNEQFTPLGSSSAPRFQTGANVVHARWPADARALNTEAGRAYRLVGYPLVMETGFGRLPDGGSSVASGWWTWTAPVSGPVQMEVTGTAAALGSVIIATVPGASPVPVSSTRWRAGRSSSAIFTALAGTTYYFRITPSLDHPDSIRLRIGPPPAPPANDNFASAIHLGSTTTAAASGSNVGATQEGGEVAPQDEVYGKSVWFRWTAPYSGQFLVTFAGQPVGLACYVTTGNAPGSLTLISLDTEGRFIFTATAGATYNLMLDVLQSDSGTYTLSILPVPVVASSSVSTVPGGRTFNLGWRSEPFTTYRIEQSTNLQTWSPVVTRFSSEGTATDIAITGIPLATPKIYFRVLRE